MFESELEFLEENYGLTVHALSPDKHWYVLTDIGSENPIGIGCILKYDQKNNNKTFQMHITLPYGEFKYMEMNTIHLGAPSDLAFDRLDGIVSALRRRKHTCDLQDFY